MPGYSIGFRIRRSRAASIVVIGLLVLMMAPLLLLREYGDNLGSTYGHAKTISQALMGLLMLMFPFFRRPQIGNGGGLLSLWTLFIVFAFLSMAWSIDPARTFLFSATFALLIWIGYGLFLEDFPVVRSAFRSMSVLILAFFALAAVLLPLHGGRGFGAISPTIPAAFGFLAIFGQYISVKRSRYFLPIVLVSTYLVFFAQARTVLVALVVFFFARYVMMPIMIRLRSVSAFLLFSTLAAIISMIAIMLFMKMLMGTVDNVAGVHNASRTGDNFSGRLLYWTLGLELFLQSPAIGFGFGTRTAADDVLFGPSFSAHSGAINLMLDLGIVGAALFALIYLASLAAIYRAALKPSSGIDYLSVLSFMIAFVPILAIEPTYISFGNPSSYGFELCLAAALAVRRKAAEQVGSKEPSPNSAFSLA